MSKHRRKGHKVRNGSIVTLSALAVTLPAFPLNEPVSTGDIYYGRRVQAPFTLPESVRRPDPALFLLGRSGHRDSSNNPARVLLPASALDHSTVDFLGSSRDLPRNSTSSQRTDSTSDRATTSGNHVLYNTPRTRIVPVDNDESGGLQVVRKPSTETVEDDLDCLGHQKGQTSRKPVLSRGRARNPANPPLDGNGQANRELRAETRNSNPSSRMLEVSSISPIDD